MRNQALLPWKATRRHAGVSILLRGEGARREVLMIQRAINVGDRWSGHIAFPGGRSQLEDASILETCIRETREEIGIGLDPPSISYLGPLGSRVVPGTATMKPLTVHGLLFQCEGDLPLQLDPKEVHDARWIPLQHFQMGHYFVKGKQWTSPQYKVAFHVPSIVLPPYEDVHKLLLHNHVEDLHPKEWVLWGLTLSFLQDLLHVLEMKPLVDIQHIELSPHQPTLTMVPNRLWTHVLPLGNLLPWAKL